MWLRGFTAEGLNLERFLTGAAEAGIRLTAVRRHEGRLVSGCVGHGDYARLAALAQQGGWQLTEGAQHGLGRLLQRMRQRWLLAAAVVLASAAVFAGTQVMWRIDVTGGGAYEADIRQALHELGVRAPMLRRQVEPRLLRDALEWRYPRIAWIECGWRGMTLEVRVVEGLLPGEDGAAEGACAVVAARDGIVERIVTRAGTPVVTPGQLVRKGQVLISGEERTGGGLTRAVAARGSVYARVWDAAAVQTPLYETETVYTGRTQETCQIVCPWFSLLPDAPEMFEHRDVAVRELPLGGFFLPLTIRSETRLEAQYTSQRRSLEALKAEASAAALQKLYAITGGRESVVDNWVNCSIIEDEILLSVAYGERLMDIARQERDSVMAAAE